MSSQDQTTVNQGTGVDESLRTDTIFQTAKRMPELSRFVEAIEAAGLKHELETEGFKTLFAPSNEALDAAAGWWQKLTTSEAQRLATVVGNHIAMGGQTEADLRTATELRTLSGQPLSVRYEPDGARVGDAKIVHRDISCLNGQIQILDGLAVAP